MKLIHKIIAAAATVLALSSCAEDALEPLTGKYEKPVAYEMNTLKSQSVEKSEQTRTFSVELACDNATLSMKFVGNKYFLPDNSYTAAAADVAKNGNYIVGPNGSTFTLNGNAVNVNSGTLTVKQEDGFYTFKGTLWLADESVINVSSKVTIVYEADPEPIVMNKVASTRNNVKDGGKTVTINLATSDVKSFDFDWITWSGFIGEGTGQVFSLDLYSTDGYMHEGTYTAGDSNALAEGQFGTTYSLFGMVPNHGTCLWDVNNGVLTPTEITAGTVTVTRKGNKWVIEYICGEGKDMVWIKFEGAIDALTPQDSANPTAEYTMADKVEPVYDATYAVVAGVEKHTVTLTKGEEVAAIFELITAEGGVIEGTYDCQEYASAAGLMGNGYSFPDWNVEGGSRYWVNGELVLINAGETLEVTKYAEGLYGFEGSTGYSFVAQMGDAPAQPEQPDNPEPEAPEYTEFTKLLVYQANQETDPTTYQPTGKFLSVTVKLGTEGMSTEVVNNGWYDETKIKGNGQVLSIDFYTTDGTISAGTYTAAAEGGVIGEGEFGIGYDVEMWGQKMVWGTCVTPYEKDTEGTIEKVVDGTITVEVSGDTYTITLESSTVKAQYVGPMTL